MQSGRQRQVGESRNTGRGTRALRGRQGEASPQMQADRGRGR